MWPRGSNQMPMLKTIKKIFSSTQPSETQPDRGKKTNISPNFLTDPFRINKLLHDLLDHPQLCTVTFSGKKQNFSTSILEIHPETRTIILDELHPQPGNTLLQQANKCKLSTHLRGIHLAFALENPSPVHHQGLKAYKVNYPDRIYYPQRRNASRVKIQTLHIPFAGTCLKNQASAGGQLYDLSRTGVGITLSDNHARIQRGDRLKRCHIVIDNYRLNFDLSICFVKKDPTGKTNIGGFIENISTRDQNRLSTFVAKLERKQIRHTRKSLI